MYMYIYMYIYINIYIDAYMHIDVYRLYCFAKTLYMSVYVCIMSLYV